MACKSGWIKILTMSCRDHAEREGADPERPLTISERVALALHRVICVGCRRFRTQVQTIHTTANAPDPEPTTKAMPDDTRLRLIEALRREQQATGNTTA